MSIAACYSNMGNKEKAIYITESLVDSRKRARTSEEDRANFFPALLFSLSNLYGQEGRIKESIKACEQGLEVAREYNSLNFIPRLLHNLATGLRRIGEEEQIYKPHLIRAYHCAYAIGQTQIAKGIKEDAEKRFNIVID